MEKYDEILDEGFESQMVPLFIRIVVLVHVYDRIVFYDKSVSSLIFSSPFFSHSLLHFLIGLSELFPCVCVLFFIGIHQWPHVRAGIVTEESSIRYTVRYVLMCFPSFLSESFIILSVVISSY